MTAIDDILNTVVPIGITIFFIFILGKALAKPLGELAAWIKGLFARKEEGVISTPSLGYE